MSTRVGGRRGNESDVVGLHTDEIPLAPIYVSSSDAFSQLGTRIRRTIGLIRKVGRCGRIRRLVSFGRTKYCRKSCLLRPENGLAGFCKEPRPETGWLLCAGCCVLDSGKRRRCGNKKLPMSQQQTGRRHSRNRISILRMWLS